MLESVATVSWTDWHWHPSVLAGLLALEGLYLLGVGPLRRRYGWAQSVARSQTITFSLGVLALFVALLSPIHELGDTYLFSAHMLQHLLLIMVVSPLLLLGTPAWLLRPLLSRGAVLWTARFLTHPVVVFALFNGVLIAWHAPQAYDLALRVRGVHIFQHLTFLATGILLWWPILSPVPELNRLPAPLQMLYLFAQSVPMGFLGAAFAFAQGVLYPQYALAPRVWGLSPIVDQQIGGVLMKTAGSLVFLLVLAVVFFAWFNREEAAQGRAAGPITAAGYPQGNGHQSRLG